MSDDEGRVGSATAAGPDGAGGDELTFARGLSTLARARQLSHLATVPRPSRSEIRETLSLLPEVCDTLETLLATLAEARPDPVAAHLERYHRLLVHEVRNRANLVNLSLAQWDARCQHDGIGEVDGPFIEAARRALASLTEMVGDPELLASARERAAGPRLRPLSEVVQQVVAATRPLAAARGTSVSAEDPLTDRAVDPRRMELVLLNLVLNSIDHADPDKPERWVRLGAHGSEDSALQVRVSDNGAGMPPDLARRVFDEGFRREGPAATGRGLGLAIVRQTVERMGGRVWLRSRQGVGTTVWLEVAAPRPEGGGDGRARGTVAGDR